jgi:phosphoribosylformylglycinamidine synthase
LVKYATNLIGTAPNAGDLAVLVGATQGHLGQSAILAEVFNRVEGAAPAVDLDAEKRNGDFIRDNANLIKACTDLSDGGLALAAFEMAEASDVGVVLDAANMGALFGETQGRYLVACNFDQAEALMAAAGQAGVPIRSVGKFAGTDVSLGGVAAPLAELREIYKMSFGNTFA